MNIWSYCAADWRRATQAAGGVKPLLCPPLDSQSITSELAKAAQSDLVYLNLHGFVDKDELYGQSAGGLFGPALTAKEVIAFDWSGVVVFMEVCFSAKDGGNKVARAFLENGATAVIGSTTEAYGRVRPALFDGEADRLLYFFRKAYESSHNPHRALDIAKRWLRAISWPLDKEDRATLKSFVLLEQKEYEKPKTL